MQVGDTDEAWQTRECGVLALGCVSDGCGMFISEHFGQLLPYLIAQVKDRRVRACAHTVSSLDPLRLICWCARPKSLAPICLLCSHSSASLHAGHWVSTRP